MGILNKRKLWFLIRLILVTGFSLGIVVLGNMGLSGEEVDQSLVGYWTLNESQGDTIRDSSPNGNDGKVSGVTWEEGVSGTGLKLNGKDDYGIISNPQSFNFTDRITIELWFKPETVIGQHCLIHYGQYDEARLDVKDGRISATVVTGNWYSDSYAGISPDKWYQVALTYDCSDGYFTVYINGAEVGKKSTDGKPLRPGPFLGYLFFGMDGLDRENPYSGLLDEVKLYSRRLTAKEIEEHFQKEKMGIPEGHLGIVSTQPVVEIPLPTSITTSLVSAAKKLNFDFQKSGNFYFIQITDTHIAEDRYPDNSAVFKNFINEMETMKPKPAFVVVTGDLVDNGSEEYWQNFHQLVTEFKRRLPEIPFHIVLGNHDDHPEIYFNLFPENKYYYSFDLGGVRFIALYPFPNECGPIEGDDKPGLGGKQTEWLKSQLRSPPGKTAVVFLHHPPISGDYVISYLISDLQSGLSELNPETELWIFGGHWHGNELFRVGNLRKDKLVPTIVTTPVQTGQTDRSGYRVVFVQGGRIIAQLPKVYPDYTFKFDPPVDTWRIHYPFSSPENPLLSFTQIPDDDKKYLFNEKDSIIGCGWRDISGKDGFVSYHLPLPPGTTHLGVSTIWEYLVEASVDGKNYRELAKSCKGENGRAHSGEFEVKLPPQFAYYQVLIPLSEDLLASKDLYLRFRDPFPDSKCELGIESGIEWFSLLGTVKE